MSLYNLMFGTTDVSDACMDLLGSVHPIDAGRFRDAWIEADGLTLAIAVYTRNGGGNREMMEDAIESMQAHPWFLTDSDDDFDCTYATFYFQVPNEPEMIAALFPFAVPPVDMSVRWTALIDSLRDGLGK